MNAIRPKSKQFIELRNQAEEFLDKNPKAIIRLPVKNAQNLLEELQIHQIELEMQNEELRQTQLQLEAARDRFSDLYDFAPVGYFTISEKGTILEVNLTGAELVGTERSALIERRFSQFIHKESQTDFYFHCQRLFGTKVPQRCELKLTKKGGAEFHAQMESIVVQGDKGNFSHRASISDITERVRAEEELQKTSDELERRVEERTKELFKANNQLKQEIGERKQTEEALRESEQRYRRITDTITDYVYSVRVKDGHPVETIHGPACVAVTGYSVEEFKANPLLWIQMVHKKDRKAVEEQAACSLSGAKVGAIEHRIVHKGGAICWVRNTVAQHFDGQGRLLSYDGLIQDITERKRLENQLRQAKKMEAIGILAGGIAHDFNNLLTGIKGNVSLMLMNMDSSHHHYERLIRADKLIESGAKLTSRLLGFARKGRYEVKPIYLNQLVEDVSETFGRTRKEITIHRNFDQDLSVIEADPVQIEQVLLNLFVNSADAMPGGGDLILQTNNTTHENLAGILFDPKPGNYLMLTVTDTGIGMDRKTQERIFEPFFTTKEMGHGTGLGLASAYGIIKGHNGYIECDSKKGHGTTFRIYLPSSEKKSKKVFKTDEELIKGTETVLLADDEKEVREIGREILEAMGYRVLIARDGKEAISVYERNQDKIDIVILDLIMPKLGGGDVYDKIKEINPDVKVLLSSGYSIDGKAKEILDRGCNGFIQKPYSIKKYTRKIREILDE